MLATRLEKRTLIEVLRAHPQWSLLELAGVIEADGPSAAVLAELTVFDLWNDPRGRRRRLPEDRGPLIDVDRLELAEQSSGAEFDRVVLEVLTEAGRWVSAGYLTARVGGPRWKLQSSLRRLEATESVERTGKTSSTRYRAIDDR